MDQLNLWGRKAIRDSQKIQPCKGLSGVSSNQILSEIKVKIAHQICREQKIVHGGGGVKNQKAGKKKEKYLQALGGYKELNFPTSTEEKLTR